MAIIKYKVLLYLNKCVGIICPFNVYNYVVNVHNLPSSLSSYFHAPTIIKSQLSKVKFLLVGENDMVIIFN